MFGSSIGSPTQLDGRLPHASHCACFVPRRCRQGRHRQLDVQARDYGRLVLPRDDQPNKPNRKIIIPGESGQSGSSTKVAGPGIIGGSPAAQSVVSNYRPPPGFMDTEPGNQDTGPSIHPEVLGPRPGRLQETQGDHWIVVMHCSRTMAWRMAMLNQLRLSGGPWHQRAQLLPALARAGYDALAVEEATGVERTEQSMWSTSLNVYQSLVKSGEVPPEELGYFDADGGERLLYDLRFLSIAARFASARYIAQKQLGPQEAVVLARAVKEQERRNGAKEGFSAHPGDCLAYKLFRDAIETRSEVEKLSLVQRGLKVAETEGAKAALRELGAVREAEKATAAQAQLQTIRLTRAELGFWPVPLTATLASLRAAELAGVPALQLRGPFNAFSPPASTDGQQWVVLPAWNSLMCAVRPAAVPVPNCAQVPALAAQSNVSSESGKARLREPGLLLVDTQPAEAPDANHFYLVEGPSGTEMVDGGSLPPSPAPCAVVLFCCRPPGSIMPMAAETSELLQL